MMNSSQRVEATLNLQEPDRVPIFEWEVDPFVIRSISENENIFDFIEEFDLDGVPVLADNVYVNEGCGRYLDEWGILRAKTAEINKIAVGNPLQNPNDIKKMRMPDANRPDRYDILKKVARRFKEKRSILLWIQDVFLVPRDLHGFENILMDVFDRTEFVKKLIEMSVEYNLKLAKNVKYFRASIGSKLAYLHHL